MIRVLVFSFFFSIPFFGIGQRSCGTVVYDSIRKLDSKFQQSRMEFEQKLNQHIQFRKSSREELSDSLLTIPVVVHVVYNINRPEQNISDAQIISQIKVLNEDYRRKAGTPGYNTNPVGADINIEFCLANTDPSGNSTTGITRHSTTVDGFDVYLDDVKLKSYGYWPSDKYLNIWVATLTGYLGYAQFPDNSGLDGLDPTYSTASTDGVAINHRYFGFKTGTVTNTRYNLGRTASHEIGHWLGLKHTWGDESDCSGNDYCDDTPTCSGSYFSSYSGSCPSPIQCGNTARQVQNFLDYSDDGCMNLFTLDQKTRMRTTMSVSPRRLALKNSIGCSGVSIVTIEVEDSTVKFYPNPMENTLTVETLKPVGFKIYDLNGRIVFQSSVSIGSNQIEIVLASGVYIFEAEGKRSKLMVK